MKRFLTWYGLLLKAQVKRIDTWLALFALLFLTLTVANIKLPSLTNTKVLLYSKEPSVSQEIFSALESGDHIFTFEIASSEEELKDQVLSGKVECGFVISDDFKEKLKSNKQTGLVDLYCTGFSTKVEVAQETFYAGLFSVASQIWLKESMDQLYTDADENTWQTMESRQQELKESGALFCLYEMTIDKEGNITDKQIAGEGMISTDLSAADERIKGRTYPVRGTVAIFLFVLIFLAIGRQKVSDTSGFSLYLMGRDRMVYHTCSLLAELTLPIILSVLLLITTHTWPQEAGLGILRFVCFLLYSIFWCKVLSIILKKQSVYRTSLIAVLLFTIIFSPAYLYIYNQIPVAKGLRFLLPVSVFLG